MLTLSNLLFYCTNNLSLTTTYSTTKLYSYLVGSDNSLLNITMIDPKAKAFRHIQIDIYRPIHTYIFRRIHTIHTYSDPVNFLAKK